MLPDGARRIVEARLKGNRPADPIVISFAGKLDWGNPIVYAKPGITYDWRFVYGLAVIVAVVPGIDVRDPIEAIYREAMLYPTLVDVQRRRMASILEIRPYRLWPITDRHPSWKELFA